MGDSDPTLGPSNLELPPDRRFAHGIIDWALGNRLTARELAMLDLINTITDQPEWHMGVFDAATVREWRVEAARNLLISQRTWDWCDEELRCKADEFRRTDTVLVLDAGSRVAKSEPPALRDGTLSVLRAAVAEMRPECTWDDVFPSVLNMVHPSYYPFIYGRTRILPNNKKVERRDIWAHFGNGTTSRLENHRLVELMVEDRLQIPRYGGDGSDVLDYLPFDYNGEAGRPLAADRAAIWAEEKPWRYSNRFQWLPTDVEFLPDDDYGVRLVGYINNLHPFRFADVYSAIEQVISTALPHWNSVVMRVNPDMENRRPNWNVSFGRTPPRINLFGLLRQPRPPVPPFSGEEGDFYTELRSLRYRRDGLSDKDRRRLLDDVVSRMERAPKDLPDRVWAFSSHPFPQALRLRNLVHPEPGTLFTVAEWLAGRNVGRVIVPKSPFSNASAIPRVWGRGRGGGWGRGQGHHVGTRPAPIDDSNTNTHPAKIQVVGPLNFVDKPVQLHSEYRATGLQVYVKIQSIEVDVDSPVVPAGEWALEGMFNEHIIATSIYFFDIEEVSTVRLSFQQPTNFMSQRESRGPAYELGSVFAWEGKYTRNRRIDYMQRLGTLTARQGRLASFPGTLQYRFEPITLREGATHGHVRFLIICLADPNYRIMSTSRVSPQRLDWWVQDAFPYAYLAERGLPAELRQDIIMQSMDGSNGLLKEDEAAQIRAKTAWERIRMMAEVNGFNWQHSWIDINLGSESE